jgi:hypothetical protein
MATTDDHLSAVPTCSNHPDVQTRLTCSSCGTPICPRCMVPAAVGQKCPACARQSRRARGTPTVGPVALVFAATVAGGAAGGAVYAVVPAFTFLLFIVAAVYGLGMGNLARWAARKRAHNVLGVAAVAGLIAGFAGVLVLLGGNPLTLRLLAVYAISGWLTFRRAAGL